jgi:hypothetical protein
MDAIEITMATENGDRGPGVDEDRAKDWIRRAKEDR